MSKNHLFLFSHLLSFHFWDGEELNWLFREPKFQLSTFFQRGRREKNLREDSPSLKLMPLLQGKHKIWHPWWGKLRPPPKRHLAKKKKLIFTFCNFSNKMMKEKFFSRVFSFFIEKASELKFEGFVLIWDEDFRGRLKLIENLRPWPPASISASAV